MENKKTGYSNISIANANAVSIAFGYIIDKYDLPKEEAFLLFGAEYKKEMEKQSI